MLRLAVCDDEPSAVEIIRNLVEACENNASIISFTDVSEIDISQLSELDAFILDIEMGDVNGISFASELIKTYPDVRIIFYTGFTLKYSERIFLESINLKPFALITKPAQPDTVSSVLAQLEQSVLNQQSKRRYIDFKSNRETVRIGTNDVIYAEQYRRKINISTDSGTYTFYGKLSEFFSDYPFIITHKSFSVNFKRIKIYNGTTVITDSGDEIPISRKFKDAFRKKLLDYENVKE